MRKMRPQPDRDAGQRVRTALLAIDDADRRRALEPRLAQRLNGLDRGAAGRHDVLDEANPFAGRKLALEPVAGAVLLRLARGR